MIDVGIETTNGYKKGYAKGKAYGYNWGYLDGLREAKKNSKEHVDSLIRLAEKSVEGINKEVGK